ncbi:hypothetical protein Q9R19_11540 [Microbacterium sp. ARD32]|uniref:hypothetical protein n=1 Tax=Microbacterium sp. ARD32 TaxID=2962577 RepID=UPI002882CA0D|nr:hypothetical protein [Microbacterium sp. ARD32]MDT0158260.1 hypothetical protein [Microbacterium sp. ARD32]
MKEAELAKARTESLDEFVRDLRELRELSGLSYRSIALIISQQREAAGARPGTSQIAHTTVSDAFRLGRQRVNPVLVGEIVQALGLDADESKRWRERCVAAMALRTEQVANRTPSVEHASVTPQVSPVAHRPALAVLLAVVGGGVLLNATGKFLNPLFGDIFFFDMIGTAAVAILLGPRWAALVGAIFAIIELTKGNVGDALFATTMISAGILWGYGARRWSLADTLPRFLGLSVLVALMTSALAVPITVLYFGGEPGRGFDGFFQSLSTTGANLWVVVGLTNLAVSVADKVLTGALAFYLAKPLSKYLTMGDETSRWTTTLARDLDR